MAAYIIHPNVHLGRDHQIIIGVRARDAEPGCGTHIGTGALISLAHVTYAGIQLALISILVIQF